MLLLKNQILRKTIYFFVIVSHIFSSTRAMQETEHREEQNRPSRPISSFDRQTKFLRSGLVNPIPLILESSEGNSIINYVLEGKHIGSFIKDQENQIYFESTDPTYHFLLQSPLEAEKFEILVPGKFTFQELVNVKNAVLRCKTVEFLGKGDRKFSSAEALTVEADVCTNNGDVVCTDFFCKGDHWNSLRGSSLLVRGRGVFSLMKGVSNVGHMSCFQETVLRASLFKNWGMLNTGKLNFSGKEITNAGSIDIKEICVGECETLDNQSNWSVEGDCILPRVGQLTTRASSRWNVRGDWKGNVAHLTLDGEAFVGNIALFNIGEFATLNGPLHARVIHLESDGFLTCHPHAELFVTHHVGLKSKGWLQYEGNTLGRSLDSTSRRSGREENADLDAFPRGVFLHSTLNGIKKSGRIVSQNGTVALSAKGNLMHVGLTEAGFHRDAKLTIDAKSLILEKESLLKALNARLNAQELLNQQGKARIAQQLIMESGQIIHEGESESGELFALKGREILAGKSSQINSKNVICEAEKKIDHQGSLKAQGQLLMRSREVSLGETSRISAEDAHLKAEETLKNKGSLNVSKNLSMRAKFLENSGEITAQNAHLKADRWWWNTGSVDVQENLNIDALASLNILGYIEAKKLNIHAGLDLNLLGVYRAQNANISALVGFNAGLCLPKITSWDDLFKRDNLQKTGETLLNAWAPAPIRMVYGGVKAVYNLKGMYGQIKELYKHGRDLYDQDDVGVSDWMPFLCGVKDVTLAGVQIYQTEAQIYKMMREGYKAFQEHEKKENEKKAAQTDSSDTKTSASPAQENTQETAKTEQLPENTSNAQVKTEPSVNKTKNIPYRQIASDFMKHAQELARPTLSGLVGAFGPHLSRDTFFDVDLLPLGINGHSRNLRGVYGPGFFLNNYTIETCYGTNLSKLCAAHLNVYASKRFKACADSELIGMAVSVETKSYEGGAGSKIKSTHGSHLKVEEIDNKGTIEGSFNLHFTGTPDQFKNMGTVDARGGTVHYKGAIRQDHEQNNLPTADEFAEGSGRWGNVTNARAVSFDVEQDVNFKKKHDLSHTVGVKTTRSVRFDEKMTSAQSLYVDAHGSINVNASVKADEHVGLEAKKGVFGKSTTTRVGTGTHYEDKCDPITISAGRSLGIHSGENIELKSIKTSSGAEGTHLSAEGDILDEALNLEKHSEIPHETQTGVVKDTFTTAKVSQHNSQGNFVAHAQGKCEVQAPQIKAKRIVLHGEKGTLLDEVKDTHLHDDQFAKSGWMRGSETKDGKAFSDTARGATLEGELPSIISAPKGKVTLRKVTATKKIGDVVLIIEAKDGVEFLLSENTRASEHANAKSGWAWRSNKNSEKGDITFSESTFDGEVNVYSKRIVVEAVRDQALQLLDKLRVQKGAEVMQHELSEVHWDASVSSQGPTRALSAVVVLVVTMGTAGTASSFGVGIAAFMGCKSGMAAAVLSNMSAAAFTSLCTHAAQALLENQGNVIKAAHSLVESNTLKSIGISAVTGGLMGGANHALNMMGVPHVSGARNFGERLAAVAPREAARAGIRTGMSILLGHKPQDAIVQNVRGFVAGTLGVIGARQIGELYGTRAIGGATHKFLHTVLGATTGGLAGGRRGAMAGGLGALVAEVTADFFSPEKPTMESVYALAAEKGRPLTKDEFYSHYSDKLQAYMERVSHVHDGARLAAAMAALFAGQDVDTADLTASTALDNNFVVLVSFGITATSIAWATYQAYNTYQTKGLEEALKGLGIEIVMHVAGYGTSRMVAKFGGIIYPSIEAALSAVFAKTPGLKLAFGKLTDTLIMAGEKFNRTMLGQGITRIETTILRTEAHAWNSMQRAGQAVRDKIPVTFKARPNRIHSNGFDAVDVTRKVPKGKMPSAKSSANALRLRTELSFQEACILDREGKLTPYAIGKSEEIKVGPLKNPKVIAELTKDGSDIVDWKKYRTEAIRLSNGEGAEIHYYMNTKIGKIDYVTKDFKVKGNISLTPDITLKSNERDHRLC